MGSRYAAVRSQLEKAPKRWLVTGAAGFIGSHLVEELLLLGQEVVGVDNFATGYRHNLEDIEHTVGSARFSRFKFIEASVDRAEEWFASVAPEVDIILHQAALGSVPRSIVDPVASTAANVTGFVKVAFLAQQAGIRRLVYASSSSVYGDDGSDWKENRTGRLLSPYAVTKKVNELYADVFSQVYKLQCIGLRYFNVFGARQDPNGAYAAVIPRWVAALLSGEQCVINGDGKTSRDFCYIKNVVQANILAGVATLPEGVGSLVVNVACGNTTSLIELFELLREGVAKYRPSAATAEPLFGPFRAGDIRHSCANTGEASRLLGYEHEYSIRDGLQETVAWYASRLNREQ